MSLELFNAYLYVFEALFVVVVDIILPTLDTFSDLNLAIQIASHASVEEEVFIGPIAWASAILAPIVVNVAFT